MHPTRRVRNARPGEPPAHTVNRGKPRNQTNFWQVMNNAITNNRPVSVLVVEDDPGVRLVLSTILERAGLEAVTASNGREGLALFRRGRFQLIVTDLVMPDLEGLGF